MQVRDFFCLIAVAAFIFNGCAFIFQGTNENMSFDGGQGSAEVRTNGAKTGDTPCKIGLNETKNILSSSKKLVIRLRVTELQTV